MASTQHIGQLFSDQCIIADGYLGGLTPGVLPPVAPALTWRQTIDPSDGLLKISQNGGPYLPILTTATHAVPIWDVVGSQVNSCYPTSQVEFIPMIAGNADTIQFQFKALSSGTLITIAMNYAMSVANAGDVDLTVTGLILTVGSDPDGALGAVSTPTITPTAVVTMRQATVTWAVAVAEGDDIVLLLTRSAVDTHVGDFRLIDASVQIS